MSEDPIQDPYRTRRDFIREIVARDVEEDTHGGLVRTRFPPEPNGYLHIGHAKAICLDFGVAEEFGGECHLRMDDTNPLTEDPKYVTAAARDVEWLGFEWDGPIRHASDYFGLYYRLAEGLIRDGLAYVDSLSEEEIREHRGTVTEPGRASPHRDRSPEESLELFRRMRAGEFGEGEHVLRARIDMAADNMKMRDPLLYRIVDGHHYRTGREWPIYPMYDWAHPLGDALEGITHSFCTLEFEENRELYDWVVDHTRPPHPASAGGREDSDGPDAEPGSWDPRPRQYEFSRLNLDYTIMSKRKLGRLVREGDVEGWDDPRMPTLAGLRRRGVPPRAIRRFCDEVGTSRAEQRVQIAKLEHVIRDDLNRRAPRAMCVLHPLKVVIENYPEGETETLELPVYPRDVDRAGSREIPFARELFIERDDFRLDPPEGYHRLAPGREVRLRGAYFVTCREAVRDRDSGEVVELRCRYDPETRGGWAPDGRSPDGTIHWVPARQSRRAVVRLYDRLFEAPDPEADAGDFREKLNPESLEVLTEARIEPGIVGGSGRADGRRGSGDAAGTGRRAGDGSGSGPGTRFQFYRQGYFAWDREAEEEIGDAPSLVFNRIVSLRDSWAVRETQAGASEDGGREDTGPEAQGGEAPGREAPADAGEELPPEQRPGAEHVRRIPEARKRAREQDPELAERFRRYQQELGLSEEDADLLTGDRALSELFEVALDADASPPPRAVANWVVHELRGRMDARSPGELPFGGRELGELVGLVEEGRVTQPAAREVLERMIDEGGSPREIVEREGLTAISDREALDSVVEELLADHPEEVRRYRAGEEPLLGFFVGQVMRRTEGRADPRVTREMLRERLGARAG